MDEEKESEQKTSNIYANYAFSIFNEFRAPTSTWDDVQLVGIRIFILSPHLSAQKLEFALNAMRSVVRRRKSAKFVQLGRAFIYDSIEEMEFNTAPLKCTPETLCLNVAASGLRLLSA